MRLEEETKKAELAEVTKKLGNILSWYEYAHLNGRNVRRGPYLSSCMEEKEIRTALKTLWVL